MMSRILTLIVVVSIDIAISQYPPTSGNAFKHFRHRFFAMLRVRKLTPPLLGLVKSQNNMYILYNAQNIPNRRPVNPSPNGGDIMLTILYVFTIQEIYLHHMDSMQEVVSRLWCRCIRGTVHQWGAGGLGGGAIGFLAHGTFIGG